MPIYEYKGMDTNSRPVSGIFDASDPEQLYTSLRTQDVVVYSYKESVKSNKESAKFKSKDLSDFAHQLGTMLSSGISMTRALSIITQREINSKKKKIFQNLQTLVGQGISLSDAMEMQGDVFPVLLKNMLRAGETSGKMEEVAFKMADHYEKDHKLTSKVKGAMTYPLFILVLIVVVVLVIFTVVLPSFFSLFEDMDTLPWMTKVLIAFSKFLTAHWLVALIYAAIGVAVLLLIFKQPVVKRMKDNIVLKLPKIGHLMSIIYTARFARNLSSLYASGLSMIQSLQICGGLIGNSYIEDQFDELVLSVRNGVPLSQAIARVKGFDIKLASSVYVGEETGRIDEILEKVADSYEYEADEATTKLTTMIEPLMIVIMAVIVGSIMLAVIVPVYQYYQQLAG